MAFANDFINTGNDLLDYWIKVTLLFSVCYLIYKIWIDTIDYDFNFKRWFLLATGLFALLVPITNIDAFPKYLSVKNAEDTISSAVITETEWTWNYLQWASAILLVGCIFSFGRLIFSLIGLYKMILGNDTITQGKYVIVKGKENQESSFFHYIFTTDPKEHNIQIEHEKIHADQYHSLDVMLAELIQCVLWFNPLIYQFKRDIKINHEYICDQSMIEKYGLATYADTILLHHKTTYSNPLFNHFNSFIKNRITMMNHLKNSQNSKTNYFLVSTFFITVFCAFSFKTYIVPVNPQKNDTITTRDTLHLDTIITLDPETFTETVQIIQRKSEVLDSKVELEQLLKLHPEVITYSDTAFILDPETYKEKVTIDVGKMVKAYRIMIEKEWKKANPDMNKVNQWFQEGKRD
jgi:beta-lactamase regulating signal transducer with metallopeptidase domain